MRVAALTPFLSELTRSLVGEGSLIATVEQLHISAEYSTKLVSKNKDTKANSKKIFDGLSTYPIDLEALIQSQPDVILTTLPEPETLPLLREELYALFGRQIFIHHHDPVRLEDIFQMFETLGKQLKVPDKGRTVSSKAKAQLMDWSNSFYDRMKNKKVTLISSIEPLSLYARWVPDMIKLASGIPQIVSGLKEDPNVSWAEIIKFNPDVIIFAPRKLEFADTLKIFPKLEKIEGWDKIYAVKRGDVFFADGQKFFQQPTTKIIQSMAVLVSCMAGFESGYITERDSMYRLRYLELHRHKFL
jgi:iron complex transport system substrate-binding protein